MNFEMLQVNAQFLVKTSLKIVYLKKKKERESTPFIKYKVMSLDNRPERRQAAPQSGLLLLYLPCEREEGKKDSRE